MGKLTKIILSFTIIAILFMYIAISVKMNESFKEKISEVETQIELINKKRDYYINSTISLEAIKKELCGCGK